MLITMSPPKVKTQSVTLTVVTKIEEDLQFYVVHVSAALVGNSQTGKIVEVSPDSGVFEHDITVTLY